ncbi:MAG TPA: hypothetical protein VHD32_01195 [Candidatus Didemnitutus sp.]|nr:hypothetical protein [Candidatus Didemnitutus sp.]
MPACSACNQGASQDEEYLLTVLAQIGTSPALAGKVAPGGVVDRALARSPRFAESIERALTPQDGRIVLQVDTARIERTVRKLAAGLLYLRYGAPPKEEDVSRVFFAPYNIDDLRRGSTFIATFTERFVPKRWKRIQAGIFSYIVVRASRAGYICIVDIHQTLWAEVHLRRLPRRTAGVSSRSVWRRCKKDMRSIPVLTLFPFAQTAMQ